MSEVKILIVEDERIIAEDTKQTLESLKYKVCGIASSGEEAIRIVEDSDPDLILMDIKIKGPMDGIETAEKINHKRDIPLIYVTAYADEETLQRAKITEPYGYILKPIRKNELKIAVEIVLYKHRMEKQLRDIELISKQEKLEAVQQLAGAVAHEFNQPLQALMIISELLPVDKLAEREDLAGRISEQVARMSELVNKLENLDTIKTKSYVGRTRIIDIENSSNMLGSDIKRVLLIDDDHAIVRLLSRIIRKQGFEVDAVKSAEDALLYLAKNEYGLVICDIKLPGISGLELYESERTKNKNTPFVFISGYVLDELSDSVINKSAGFLPKPFSIDEVITLLNNAFRN